jgi:hypothetical protein
MRGGLACSARQRSEGTPMAGRITGAALLVLFGCPGAFADSCIITNRQVYNLVADTVNWSMTVGNGQYCRWGIRYTKVLFERMTLVSPPRSGQVVLQGSAFTYVPKKDFQGDDSFDLEVAGQIQKVRGASKIHVVVSVRSATKSPAQATVLVPAATPHKASQTGPVPGSGGPTPPIKDALGPGPVRTPPALDAAPVPVPQLGSGPMPVPIPPRPGAAPGPTPPVPTASSVAPPSLWINPARSP